MTEGVFSLISKFIPVKKATPPVTLPTPNANARDFLDRQITYYNPIDVQVPHSTYERYTYVSLCHMESCWLCGVLMKSGDRVVMHSKFDNKIFCSFECFKESFDLLQARGR